MIMEPYCLEEIQRRDSDDAPLSVCLQTSVLHMCSLFHAFMFAQLWTIYCEQAAANPTNQNQNEFSSCAILTGLEFWSRVTPSILQLMAHNKVVNLQFIQTLCDSFSLSVHYFAAFL